MEFERLKKINENLKTTPIKGKDYVEVNKRVMGFRELEPNGTIETEIVSLENGTVVIKATVADGDGKVLATGYAYEKETSSYINKTSFIENCETSAVGRALGFCGIGIDASIGSYEEVANAIKQQEDIKAKKAIDKELSEEASPLEKKSFMDMCELLNVDYKTVLKQAGVTGKMTKEQHAKAMIILKEIQDEKA